MRLRNNSSGAHMTQINDMGRATNIDEINNILAQ